MALCFSQECLSSGLRWSSIHSSGCNKDMCFTESKRLGLGKSLVKFTCQGRSSVWGNVHGETCGLRELCHGKWSVLISESLNLNCHSLSKCRLNWMIKTTMAIRVMVNIMKILNVSSLAGSASIHLILYFYKSLNLLVSQCSPLECESSN